MENKMTLKEIEKEIEEDGTFTSRETREIESMLMSLISGKLDGTDEDKLAWSLNELVCLKEHKSAEVPVSNETIKKAIKDGIVSVSVNDNTVVFDIGGKYQLEAAKKENGTLTDDQLVEELYKAVDSLRQPEEWKYTPEFEDLIDRNMGEWSEIKTILEGRTPVVFHEEGLD